MPNSKRGWKCTTPESPELQSVKLPIGTSHFFLKAECCCFSEKKVRSVDPSSDSYYNHAEINTLKYRFQDVQIQFCKSLLSLFHIKILKTKVKLFMFNCKGYYVNEKRTMMKGLAVLVGN
ncbi:hypothetical protein KFK09_026167 [Dendrobium nobile]|uniref:Uncharacterized protein n=1 Tax=Dendrobium nobile TaxID=94219 RepID=A0A8T3AC47_DENNO|nr:hypothetical protein KFK09_026167 [Dendrobium nobile]